MRLAGMMAAMAMVAGCGDRPAEPLARERAPSDNRPTAVEPDQASAANSPATAKPGRASIFTKLDDRSCSKEEVVAENGDWDRRCRGVAPYALEWMSGDLREDLSVVLNGRSTRLNIPQRVANGAFDAIAPTIEWRGPTRQSPDVLVARVLVARQDGSNDSGSLVVARLSDKPCLVAVIRPGPGQNDRARKIADGPLPACLPD